MYKKSSIKMCLTQKQTYNGGGFKQIKFPEKATTLYNSYEKIYQIASEEKKIQMPSEEITPPPPLKPREKYTIIRPTKVGGTAVSNYLITNFVNLFQINYFIHDDTCTNENKPIIILRDPVSRFISTYKYWKNGSKENIRPPEFIEEFKEYTIKDFINLIKIQDHPKIYSGFFWSKHMEHQTYWLKPNVYNNAIVIKYCPDLKYKLNDLLEYLKLPQTGVLLEKENVSIETENIELDEDDYEWIYNEYMDDFELWDKVNNLPELFKKVL